MYIIEHSKNQSLFNQAYQSRLINKKKIALCWVPPLPDIFFHKLVL